MRLSKKELLEITKVSESFINDMLKQKQRDGPLLTPTWPNRVGRRGDLFFSIKDVALVNEYVDCIKALKDMKKKLRIIAKNRRTRHD